jgi:hypothetical protein
MLTMDEPSGRVRRWSMRLMGLNCVICHRRGKQNLVADALSQSPVESNVVELRERLVDDLLPIEDPPFEPRLSFAAEEVPPPGHMCTRCTSAAVLQGDAAAEIGGDVGNRDVSWEEWYSDLDSTSTPKKSSIAAESSFIRAMIGFTTEPDELTTSAGVGARAGCRRGY